MMEEMTLAEAYRRRESIDRAGQAIYCKGRRTGTVHRIVFHARQPDGNWYNVWLVTDDDVCLVAMQAAVCIYIAQAGTDRLQMISQDGAEI